jgi:hypothetical protein
VHNAHVLVAVLAVVANSGTPLEDPSTRAALATLDRSGKRSRLAIEARRLLSL